MTCHDREQLLEGPAGSGKTRPILELFHLFATQYPGFRGLIVRKVGATLATSCLVTFRRNVLKPEDRVVFFGGSKDRPAAFQYPNGSEIVVGGLDVGADGQYCSPMFSIGAAPLRWRSVELATIVPAPGSLSGESQM